MKKKPLIFFSASMRAFQPKLTSRLNPPPHFAFKRTSLSGLTSNYQPNRLTQVVDALNGSTGFGYDPNSNLLSVTDAKTPGGVTATATTTWTGCRRGPIH